MRRARRLQRGKVELAGLLPHQLPLLHPQRGNSRCVTARLTPRGPARRRDVSCMGGGRAQLIIQHFLCVPVALDQAQIQSLQPHPLLLAVLPQPLVAREHRRCCRKLE